MNRVAFFIGARVLCVACTNRQSIRRKTVYTYLAVLDDKGGKCGPIKVDGKVWPYSIGQTGRAEPGRHTTECGGDIQFDIPEGVTFKFDYGGP